MRAVRVVTGTAAPLPRSDVDTDQIIPSEWLKRVERTGFGEGLFSAWRSDPEFVLNRPEHVGARILLAGANFGTGSSREHAVWALLDYGFEVVVSPRFADIFRNNCTKSGLLPVEVDPTTMKALFSAVADDPAVEVTVDLHARTVAVPAVGLSAPFPLDDFTRTRFLEGLDDVALTLRHEDAIARHEEDRPSWLPTAAAGAGRTET